MIDASPRILVRPYDDRWPTEFEELETLLREALGDLAERIDHIGSTSVPGLAAKDVIDIQISVVRLRDPRLDPAFEQLGAMATDLTSDHVPPGDQSDPSAREKRYFRPPTNWRQTHVHVREVGQPNQRYALLFRDYLRHSPDAATAYAQIKLALARLHPDDVLAYHDVKDPVCDLVMEAAELWANHMDWSQPRGSLRAHTRIEHACSGSPNRPDLPHGGRLRSPGSAAIRARSN